MTDNNRIQLLIDDVRDIRRRLDETERRLAQLEGALKALAVIAPLVFTVLNIILRLLRVV